MTSRYWEFQEEQQASVAGRISKHADFWENQLNAPPFILDIVKNGFKANLTSTPPSFFARNNNSSLKHEEFVSESINKLLQDNCIKEVQRAPVCVNPLSVAEKPKLRLVIDLRHVNKFIELKKFKYENIRTISEIFDKDDYFFTFDLKSGYHHVKIHEDFQPYLGFSWVFNGGRKFFQFLVLPFGLSIACYIFTTLMRQLIKRWRSVGTKCAMYLDDGIGAKSSLSETCTIRDKMLDDLDKAGLTINSKKSVLTPTRRGKWIGFVIDTKK